MSKVYAVMWEIYYEDASLVGVYSTREKATEKIIKITKDSKEKRYDVNGDCYLQWGGKDVASYIINEMEIDE